MPADHRRVLLAGAGLATAWLLTACMAWPGLPQPVADPWADALQACALGDDTLSLSSGALPADAVCTRARVLGQGLHCLGRQLPALPSAQARFTSAGLLEFQHCLQPLADGLMAGRLGRPLEIDLALRQCVLQLDRAPAGPRPRPPCRTAPWPSFHPSPWSRRWPRQACRWRSACPGRLAMTSASSSCRQPVRRRCHLWPHRSHQAACRPVQARSPRGGRRGPSDPDH